MKKKSWIWIGTMVIIAGISTGGMYWGIRCRAEIAFVAADSTYHDKAWMQALEAYRKITPLQRRFLSPLRQADVLINTGNCLYEMEKYDAAVPFFVQAADYVEKHELLNKIEAPTQLYNRLGEGYEDKKDNVAAEKTYLRGIDKIKATYGESYPGIGLLQSRLGKIYLLAEEYSKGLNHLEQALKNQEFIDQQSDSGKSIIYWKLGAAYCHNNKPEEAFSAYEKCLFFASKSYGNKSTQIAGYLSGMALVYYKQKKYKEAINLLDRAYDILKDKYGKEHSATQRIAELRHVWTNESNTSLSGYLGRP